MPTNSFIYPISGTGYARSACLATFASGIATVSGLGLLSLGDYESGTPYYFNAQNVIPVQGATGGAGIPSPVIFGDWVYYVLGGALPTMQPNGGIEFVGGGYGGANWINLAYTGTHGFMIQANYGGILGFDSSITDLSYVVTGTEIFSLEYQVLDNLPQQIELELYESSLGWHKAYFGTDQFGLGGYNAGPIPPVINNWVQLTFTPAQVGLTPGMIITGVAWGVYNQTGTSTVVFSDTSNLNQSSAPIDGFIDTCQDSNVGFYILAKTGPLFRIPAAGAGPLVIPVSDSPSYDYTGMTYNPTDQNPYFIGYDGTVYKYTGTVNTVTAPPSGVTVPARQLFNDGSNLYTLFANSNEIAKYNISGNTWSLVATPSGAATLETIHYSHSLSTLLAGGSNYTSLNNTNTIEGMAFSGADSQLLTTDSSNHINIYNSIGEQFIEWILFQQIAGTGNPFSIAVEPNGLQALVTDPVNNEVQVLTNTLGNWAATSTVSLTNPTSIVMATSTVTQALICQPSLNQITVLNKSLLNWTSSQVIALSSSPTSIAVSLNSSGTYNGVVTTSTGVTLITFNGTVWTVIGELSLSPIPVVATADFVNPNNPYLYAVGSTVGNTTVYVFENNTLAGQYTVNGSLGTLGVVNFQVVFADSSGNVQLDSFISGVTDLGTVESNVAPTNPSLMAFAAPEIGFLPLLLIAGPNNIWSFYLDSPLALRRASSSFTAILNGVSWNEFDLKDDNRVTSITTDPSGFIYTILTDNVLYKHSSLGILSSGYPFTLVPPPNQEQTVPLGFSRLLYWNGYIVSSSSLMGGITVIKP